MQQQRLCGTSYPSSSAEHWRGNLASKQTAKTIGILLNAISTKVRDLGSCRPPTPQMLRDKVNVF